MKTATKKKNKTLTMDLNVYKVIAEETEYSRAATDYETVLFTYAPMPDSQSKTGYYKKGVLTPFSKKNKLYKEGFYTNLHTAFRKGIDTKASCIVYKAMSILKEEHRQLLVDTFLHVLPDTMSCDNDEQRNAFGMAVEYAFDLFFQRLEGKTISFENERKLPDAKKKKLENERTTYFHRHYDFFEKNYGKNHKIILDNFRLATEIEKEQSFLEKKDGVRTTHYNSFAYMLYEYDWKF
jgi:hypothetical protein